MVPEMFPVFTGVSVIEPLPDAVTPDVIGPEIVLVHVKVDPDTDDAGTKFNAVLLQICCDKVDVRLVTTGTVLTVTVTSKVGPEQPFADGVIR